MGVLQRKYELGRLEVAFIIIIFMALVGAGVYAWYLGRNKQVNISSFAECVAAGNPVMESYPEQCAANGQTFTNPEQETQQAEENNGVVTSGQNGFSIVFPENWKGIYRVMDSDWFVVPGSGQPVDDSRQKAEIMNVEAYGADGPSVFSVLIHDNFADPVGTATDYTLVNGKENQILGKKYVQEYAEEIAEGMGARLKGDKEYTYVFELGDGRELRVFYNVFVSDPRNLTQQVESVIDSIKLL